MMLGNTNSPLEEPLLPMSIPCSPSHSPLPKEMTQYARDDTHYLLYIYDRLREELWDRANGQPAQLQAVWQRSKTVCLKVSTRRQGSCRSRAPQTLPFLCSDT